MDKQGIREQVKALMNRNDFSDALANTFIDQAVGRIQRTLRIPSMEKSESYVITESMPQVLFLPPDFLSMKFLFADDRMLEYVDLSTYLATPTQPGYPRIYTRVGGSVQLKPIPSEGMIVTLVYYGEIPDLEVDSDESWLSELAPDLLVYGALTFAADYFVDERKSLFEERFATIYSELEEQARILEMEQTSLIVKPAYSNY